jgi:hypothetical protein
VSSFKQWGGSSGRTSRTPLRSWWDDALPPGDIDAFVAAIAKRGGNVASVVYEGDGHFYRRENQLDYLARVEALFARCLGGRAEPMAGDKYPGSTARVITGGN